MRKLAKIAAPALAAIAALGIIAPASAQTYYGQQDRGSYDTRHDDRGDYRSDYRGGGRGDQRLTRSLRNQINQLQRVAESSRGRDARYARQEARKLSEAFNNYTRNGLDSHEIHSVEWQIERIGNMLNRGGRGGYGRDDYGQNRDGRGW